MLEASKDMRHMQSLEHGDISDAGLKVDRIFMYKGIELSTIEFKRAEIGARDLAIQNRKNVRLARCIQEVHASLGVGDPSIFMADVHGRCNCRFRASIAGLTKSSHIFFIQHYIGFVAIKCDQWGVLPSRARQLLTWCICHGLLGG
jgi:hypothetical protein